MALSTVHRRMAFSFQDCKKVIVQVFMTIELYSSYITTRVFSRDIKFYLESLEEMMRIPWYIRLKAENKIMHIYKLCRSRIILRCWKQSKFFFSFFFSEIFNSCKGHTKKIPENSLMSIHYLFIPECKLWSKLSAFFSVPLSEPLLSVGHTLSIPITKCKIFFFFLLAYNTSIGYLEQLIDNNTIVTHNYKHR